MYPLLPNIPGNSCSSCSLLQSDLRKLKDEVKTLEKIVELLRNEFENNFEASQSTLSGKQAQTWVEVARKGLNRTRTDKMPQNTTEKLFKTPTSNKFEPLDHFQSTGSDASYKVPFKDDNEQSNSKSSTYMVKEAIPQVCPNDSSKSVSSVSFYADSHGRGCASVLVNRLDKVCVTGIVKPNATISEVTRNVIQDCSKATKSDFVVIIGGTNDVSRNQSHEVIHTLNVILPYLQHTNAIVCNVPHRYGLSNGSCVNEEIENINISIL